MILYPGADAFDRVIDGLPPVECQNLYPESVPEETGVRWALVHAPGTESFAGFAGSPRGIFSNYGVFDGDIFSLQAGILYRIDSAGTTTAVAGPVLGGTGPAIFASVRGYLAFTVNGNAYVYDGTDFSAISDPDLPTIINGGAGVGSVAAMDGRIIFTENNSDRIWWTGIFDPDNIEALAFATAETGEDNLQRIIADHRELWLFGETTTEVWRPVSDFEQPFQRVGDVVHEKGTLSPHSVVKADNTLFWVGQDRIVYRAQGSGYQRISNHGIERALGQLTPVQLGFVRAFSYTDEGHVFYVLTLRNIATFVFDTASGRWHRRKTSGMADWDPFAAVDAFSGVYVATDNGISRLSRNILSDHGSAIERKASVNIPSKDRQAIERFALSAHALSAGGVETQITLDISFSDDAGRSYSAPESLVLHGQAEYGQRASLFRQGQIRTPGRVYRIETEDAARLTIGPVFINEPLH